MCNTFYSKKYMARHLQSFKHIENKYEYNIEEAMEVAGASKAATIGTAIHALTEKLDLGLELGVFPEQWMPDIKAYEQATSILTKIYIKPTRALEFIDVEFIITPTGASFENI